MVAFDPSISLFVGAAGSGFTDRARKISLNFSDERGCIVGGTSSTGGERTKSLDPSDSGVPGKLSSIIAA